MDLDHLSRILDLVRAHNLAEFELEHDGLRLKIRKGLSELIAAPAAPGAAATTAGAPPPSVQAGSAAALGLTPVAVTGPIAPAAEEVELAVVKSPIVGTFYRSPEPEAPSFVEIGSMVKKGQVLCIIEAM